MQTSRQWGWSSHQPSHEERSLFAGLPRRSVPVSVSTERQYSLGHATSFEPLFVGTSAGDTDFWVTTYFWVGTTPEPRHLRAEEGLELAFLTEEELCNEKRSPFAVYNRKAFQAYHTYCAAQYAFKEKNSGS